MRHDVKNTPVCIVTPHFPGPMHCGGIGTAVYWQALALAQAGVPVTVFYTGHVYIETPSYWAQKLKREHGIEFVGAADWVHLHRPSLRTRKYVPQFDETIFSHWTLEFLQARKFSVVYLQDYMGHGLRALQAKKAGLGFDQTQFVLTLHGSTEWSNENLEVFAPNVQTLAVQYIEKECARLSDQLIAPSAYMKNWVNERWKIDSKKISVVPYCFEDPARGASTQEYGPFHHLVFLGRLETRKGLEIFTEAIMGSELLRKKIKRVTYLGQSGLASGLFGRQWLETVGLKNAPFKYEIQEKLDTFQAWEWIKAQKNILVAAPSLMDNLPLAVIEPFLRRIPFVTTNVGGIPEIVGQNPEVLMEATAAGVRAHLEGIFSRGTLRVRYNTGFQPIKTRAQNVAFHKKVCAMAKPLPAQKEKPTTTAQLSVIVAHTGSARDLRRALNSLGNQKTKIPYEILVVYQKNSSMAEQKSFERLMREYKNNAHLRFAAPRAFSGTPEAYNLGAAQTRCPYIAFFDVNGEAYPDFVESHLRALQTADAVSGYFESVAAKNTSLLDPSATVLQLHTPLGAALEAGLFRNFFGQGCIGVRREVFKRLGGFNISSDIYKKLPEGEWMWDFLAKLSLAGKDLAILPKVLFRHKGSTEKSPEEFRRTRFKNRSIIFERYSTPQAQKQIDWKHVFAIFEGGGAATTSTEDTTPELYHYFAKLSDDRLLTVIGRKKGSPNDDTIAHLRTQLSPILRAWTTEKPRVFIYGAGQHTRVLLGSVPEVAKYVTGVIDRASDGGKFLGWPCVSPDKFNAKDCDVVLYSSKESELMMYKNICQHDVEHILLYNKIPAKC